MKPVHTALALSAIFLLFVAWNFKSFTRRPGKKLRATKSARSTRKPVKLAVSGEEGEGPLFLQQVLALNHAAHLLTRSPALLEKLLKLPKAEACATLIRGYELSSVMVLVRRESEIEEEEGGGLVGAGEGFKKIAEIVKEKEGAKGTEGTKQKEMSISKPTDSHADSAHAGQADSHSHEHDHHHNHNKDSLDIALYCRNVERPPRIGRVVRMVEGKEGDRGDGEGKYIIELVK